MKKTFQIFILIVFILISALLIFITRETQKQQKINQLKADENVKKPEFPVANNQNNGNGWLEYNNTNFNYRFIYPPEFTIEDRGKIGTMDNLLAIKHAVGGKTLTIVIVQIMPVPIQAKQMAAGKDGDGNEVVSYKYPYTTEKSITLIGTIYPNIGADYRYQDVITKIANSLTINN